MAGALIVEEAGGRASRFDGSPLGTVVDAMVPVPETVVVPPDEGKVVGHIEERGDGKVLPGGVSMRADLGHNGRRENQGGAVNG